MNIPARKYAVVGTSCSGKTTALYSITGDLRKRGCQVEALVSLDRKRYFDPVLLDYDATAQANIILQQALLETRACLRGDMAFVLADRSVIDFFGYAVYCIEDKEQPTYRAIELFVHEWVKTYSQLFFYGPLPWVSDGKRPSDEFRMAVDPIIRSLVLGLPNVTEVPDGVDREEFVTEYIWKREKGAVQRRG